eukprot:9820-Pelagococcus_subviridis.AAC.1
MSSSLSPLAKCASGVVSSCISCAACRRRNDASGHPDPTEGRGSARANVGVEFIGVRGARTACTTPTRSYGKQSKGRARGGVQRVDDDDERGGDGRARHLEDVRRGERVAEDAEERLKHARVQRRRQRRRRVLLLLLLLRRRRRRRSSLLPTAALIRVRRLRRLRVRVELFVLERALERVVERAEDAQHERVVLLVQRERRDEVDRDAPRARPADASVVVVVVAAVSVVIHLSRERVAQERSRVRRHRARARRQRVDERRARPAERAAVAPGGEEQRQERRVVGRGRTRTPVVVVVGGGVRRADVVVVGVVARRRGRGLAASSRVAPARRALPAAVLPLPEELSEHRGARPRRPPARRRVARCVVYARSSQQMRYANAFPDERRHPFPIHCRRAPSAHST